MVLTEIEYENVAWVHVAQNRVQCWALLNMEKKLLEALESYKAGNFLLA
jgi:hypothetical protein